MTYSEQKQFLNHCIDFQQLCNANKFLDCHLIIDPLFVRVICKPKYGFEDHFEYTLADSLETLTEDLMSDIEYVMDEHFKIEEL